MVAGTLDLPREREAGDGADGGMYAVAVEASAFPGRDGGAVAPRGVQVAVDQPLRAAVVEERLTVGPRGKVGRVDSDLRPDGGEVLAKGFGECVNAPGDAFPLPPQLRREPVTRPMRGGAAERVREARCSAIRSATRVHVGSAYSAFTKRGMTCRCAWPTSGEQFQSQVAEDAAVLAHACIVNGMWCQTRV